MSSVNDAKLDFYSRSVAHVLSQDRLFIADHLELSLANGSAFHFGFTIGPKKVSFFNTLFTSRSSSQVLLQLKEDSIYSGGVAMSFFSANRAINKNDPPFTDSSSGVTEDTVGTTIRNITLLGTTDKKEVSQQGEGFNIIFKPLTVYVFSVTNQDPTDSMDFDLQLSAGVSD